MTETQREVTALLVTLGNAIDSKDWPTAHSIWERLQAAHAPLTQLYPHVATVLRNNAAMVYERSASIH